jgi:glycosyltransferase involved in cell wall biosynthesis
MKPFTVIVGVPAYNEEANIAFLLEDILRQRCESFVLKEIVIVSDGSTDETSDIAKRYEFRAVSVRGDGKRKGKATRLNEIFDAARGRADAVVLFDADIALVGDEVLEKMVGAVRSGADLVSSELLALPPKTMTGRAIFASHELKRRMFAEWRRERISMRAMARPARFQVAFSPSFGSKKVSARMRIHIFLPNSEGFDMLACRPRRFAFACRKRCGITRNRAGDLRIRKRFFFANSDELRFRKNTGIRSHCW